MRKLWLARHGEAADPDAAQSDFARGLTETGRRQVSQLARWLFEREPPPELILHSPLVRAQQTAEAIAGEIRTDRVVIQVETALSPGINLDELLRRVTSMDVERVLCVGHQPDMGSCAAALIGGGDIYFSPGTIAGIEFYGPLVRQGGRLQWLASPFWFG